MKTQPTFEQRAFNTAFWMGVGAFVLVIFFLFSGWVSRSYDTRDRTCAQAAAGLVTWDSCHKAEQTAGMAPEIAFGLAFAAGAGVFYISRAKLGG